MFIACIIKIVTQVYNMSSPDSPNCTNKLYAVFCILMVSQKSWTNFFKGKEMVLEKF